MPEDDPITIGQTQYIEGLLGSTTIQDIEQNNIFREMNSYNFNQAAKCIEYLQNNQLDAVTEGANYNQKDINKSLDQRIGRDEA